MCNLWPRKPMLSSSFECAHIICSCFSSFCLNLKIGTFSLISTVPAQPQLDLSASHLAGCSVTLKSFLLVAKKGTTISTQTPDDVISCAITITLLHRGLDTCRSKQMMPFRMVTTHVYAAISKKIKHMFQCRSAAATGGKTIDQSRRTKCDFNVLHEGKY